MLPENFDYPRDSPSGHPVRNEKCQHYKRHHDEHRDEYIKSHHLPSLSFLGPCYPLLIKTLPIFLPLPLY
jgi:hypothetical protein